MVSTRQLVAAYLALLCAGLAAAEDWVMLWNDEFDAGFDRSKWTPDVGMGERGRALDSLPLLFVGIHGLRRS